VGVKVFECGGGGGRKLGVLGAVGRGESNAGEQCRRFVTVLALSKSLDHLSALLFWFSEVVLCAFVGALLLWPLPGNEGYSFREQSTFPFYFPFVDALW
jgi:hypothetical protein